jgi:hypothetical protein
LAREIKSKFCPCGRDKPFSQCCKPYFTILGLKTPLPKSETLLLAWLEKYSTPIAQSFMQKVRIYIFRVSSYLDEIEDRYFSLGFEGAASNQEDADRAIFHINHNILLSMFASLSSLAQGLFLQSGTILRSLFEDCLVLIDLPENGGQIEKFMRNKYSTNNLVSRVKKFIPDDIVSWYGYFSANFAHFGPLHPAPYIPRACYPDNWILVIGLQNIVRATVTFHLVLERIYFNRTARPLFWKRFGTKSDLIFNENCKVFVWAQKLGNEIVTQYPPDEHKEGFFYYPKSYSTK